MTTTSETVEDILEAGFPTATFMAPCITERCAWIEVDGSNGTACYPADMFTAEEAEADYGHGTSGERLVDVSEIMGYGARMSANGFLDCTDWCVFPTEIEAAKHLVETYGED